MVVQMSAESVVKLGAVLGTARFRCATQKCVYGVLWLPDVVQKLTEPQVGISVRRVGRRSSAKESATI